MKLIDEKISRRIDSAGRVSIPKHLRDKYGLDAGEEVSFFVLDDEYICVKVRGKNVV